ncbi:MAG: hypothetical protein ACPGU1_23120, partial [Myxococcota bacterium]
MRGLTSVVLLSLVTFGVTLTACSGSNTQGTDAVAPVADAVTDTEAATDTLSDAGMSDGAVRPAPSDVGERKPDAA